MSVKKIVLLLLIFCLVVSFVGCGNNSSPDSQNNQTQSTENNIGGVVDGANGNNSKEETAIALQYLMNSTGRDLFAPKNDEVQIYFFDVDNIVSQDGHSFDNMDKPDQPSIKTCDCYMIKCGNTEILVDGGYQMPYTGAPSASYSDYVINDMRDNVLRKIAALVEDGILEYLIVTHADYDHIVGLGINIGIIDAFLAPSQNSKYVSLYKEKTEENIKNAIPLSKIENIIDFNSNLVREFSDTTYRATSDSNLFLSTDIYRNYMMKIDQCVEQMGTKYVPVATFFDNDEVFPDKSDSQKSGKDIAMPYFLNDDKKTPYIAYANNLSDNEIIKATEKQLISSKYALDEIAGELKKTGKNGNERFYYSIPLVSGYELIFLYNWHYDHWYRHSVDSQDHNNISVCFEIVKGSIDNSSFKFLSLGDLGGNGEESLLKYYAGTNVLEGVTCYKLSHHSSTHNGENSPNLFRVINPHIVVTTGIGYTDYLKSTVKDSELEKVIGAVTWATKTIVDNNQSYYSILDCIDSGEHQTTGSSQILWLCTNIVSYNGSQFYSAPYYGDIYIGSSSNNVIIGNSYSGTISAYTGDRDNLTEFSTRTKQKILSIQETEWFKNTNIGFIGEEK